MAGVVVVMAIVVFLAGVLIGVIAALAVAARREDRQYALAGWVPGRLAAHARGLGGLGR